MKSLSEKIRTGTLIIQQARKRKRLSFQESVEAHGMNDQSLLRLDDITNTYNDESRLKHSKSLDEADRIIDYYQ